jgi:hypothetical protein
MTEIEKRWKMAENRVRDIVNTRVFEPDDRE